VSSAATRPGFFVNVSLDIPEKMKILVLDEEFPYPLNTGKRIRSFHLLRRLAANHDVHYLAYGETASPGFNALAKAGMNPIAVTQRVPRKSGLVFYGRLLANLFSASPYIVASHHSREFQYAVERAVDRLHPEVILCEWTPYAVYVQRIHQARTMIAAHNIEANIWRRYFEHETSALKKWYIGRQLPKVVRFERAAFGRVDGITAVSEVEAREISAVTGSTVVRVVENGVDLAYYKADNDPPDSQELVFTGSMDWRPNQDAAHYFVRDIFPRLRNKYPSLTVSFVGRNPPPDITALARISGVAITGTVDDVRPYIRRAAVYIVPLRIGGGSRLKILEALAMRKAVVSTTVGAEGLKVIDGSNILLADDPDGFAGKIELLLEDPDLRNRLGGAGRETAEKLYSWDSIAVKLDQFITDLSGLPDASSAVRSNR